jgi:diguanylate cyclase (GGDEF)-like protein/PAS domain S-box-containing protein
VLQRLSEDGTDARTPFEMRSMLGVILDAIGVPAAALQIAASGRLVVRAANDALAGLLGCGRPELAGTDAGALFPAAAVTQWAGTASTAPVEVSLGALALPHRAVVRPLRLAGDAPGLLVTFLPQAAPQLERLAGLGPSDLGVTALEVLDMQAEMVSRWRPDGTILYCNEAFARQCERPIDAVIGANLFDLTPPHEIEQIKRNVARLSAATPTAGYDHHIPTGPDGERWQEWIDRVFLDDAGRVVGYLSVGRDITARKLAERRLAESERRLKLALEAGRQGVWELDFATRRIGIDHALEDLLRLPAGAYHLDVEGAADTYHPDDREQVRAAIGAVAAGATDAYRIEARRRRGDGSYFWVMNFGRVAEHDAQGRPLRMVGTTIDIDQRKQAELSLGDREQRLRLALEAGNLGVWECDLVAERMHYGGLCLSRLGLDPEPADWPLAEALELVHPRDRGRFRAMIAQCRRGTRSQARVEYRMRRHDGSYAWIEDHAQISRRGQDDRPVQVVGVSADITARKEAEIRLAHLALHDPLTGLPNRRALAEALEQALARAQRTGMPLAVLALDLDGFKAINDRHGHPAGDATLLEVSDRLRRTIRRSDLVARLGGDEFAVIASELSGPTPVSRLAKRIGAALGAPIVLPDAVAEIAVSIGVAFYPGDGETTEELLSRADAALYAAKRERAGCLFSADLPVAAS